MAKADRRYLKLRRNVYFLNLPIPINLRPLFLTSQGTERTHIVETLHTGDLAKANREKRVRVAYWQAEFNKQGRKSAGTLPGATDAAGEYRELLKDADPLQHDILTSEIADAAYRIEATAGTAQAHAFVNLARLTGPTLREAFDAWLDGSELIPGTKAKYRNAFDVLLRFLQVKDLAPKDVTRTTALAFVDHLNKKARTPSGEPLKHATKKSYIVGLSSFWQELEHRQLVPAGLNLWHRHRLTGKDTPRDEKARAYTDAEMLRLLSGPEVRASPQTRYTRHTLMQVYALCFYTGARLGEICERHLGDIEATKGGYLLHIRKAKTPAGVRSIPILHPIPVRILRERVGKRTKPTEQLFKEFIRGGTDKRLSHYLVRAMGDYAKAVGLDRNLTDTHSTRRSFITQAEALQVFPLAVMRYVGHRPREITWNLYAQGSEAGLREVARAIRYSAPVEKAFKASLCL